MIVVFFVFFVNENLDIKILTPKDRKSVLKNQLAHLEFMKKSNVSKYECLKVCIE